MRTESQKQAARANGAKSRGPITSEGKLASSRNATTHGMLSGTIVLKGESEERFNALLADLHAELQPQTTVEITLVENMAVARWRQLRIWGIEKANMEYEMRAQSDARDAADGDPAEDTATRCALAFRSLSDDSRSLELINRYESRYDRQYLRAHHRFLQLVDRRTPPPVAAPKEPEPPVPASRQSTPGPQLIPPPENLPRPRDPVSAKRTRQSAKLMPLHRFAAIACSMILSAFSFIPSFSHEPPDRAATPGSGIIGRVLLGNLVLRSSAKLVIPNEDLLPCGSVRRAPRGAACL
jgi:hypothetical protein